MYLLLTLLALILQVLKQCQWLGCGCKREFMFQTWEHASRLQFMAVGIWYSAYKWPKPTKRSKWPKVYLAASYIFFFVTICKQLQATGREFQVLAVKVFINTISFLSRRIEIGNLLVEGHLIEMELSLRTPDAVKW